MPLSLLTFSFWYLWKAIRVILCTIIGLVDVRLVNSADSRDVSRVKTSQRRMVGGAKVISRTSTLENLCPDDPVVGNVEMDSHADTCVLGKNFIMLHSTGRVCDVYPFTDAYDGIPGVQIVTGGTAWTCQETGETFILVVPEALWMSENMPHSLINPNQLRAYGSTIQDNPFAGPLIMSDPEDVVRIPMCLEGTNVVFSTRTSWRLADTFSWAMIMNGTLWSLQYQELTWVR